MNRRVLLIGHPRRPEAYEVAERLVIAPVEDELHRRNKAREALRKL